MLNMKYNKHSFLLKGLLSLLASSCMLASTAGAATLNYHFIGTIDTITNKKLDDPGSFGFVVGDIIDGIVSIDSDHIPSSDNGTTAKFYDLEMALDFNVQDGYGTWSGWSTKYSSNSAADDIRIEIEDNHGGGGGHDKFKMEDKSTRSGITGIDDGAAKTIAFEKLKFELQANNSSLFTDTSLPTDLNFLDIANGVWPDKNTFELKFKSGGDELKLTGTLSSLAVPIPAAVWLFGSGLGVLGWFRRK
jgi:hypothetical protein